MRNRGALIGRQGFTHNTLVYQYRLCYTTPLYCTSTLYTFSYTVSTNHKSRLRRALLGGLYAMSDVKTRGKAVQVDIRLTLV